MSQVGQVFSNDGKSASDVRPKKSVASVENAAVKIVKPTSSRGSVEFFLHLGCKYGKKRAGAKVRRDNGIRGRRCEGKVQNLGVVLYERKKTRRII